MRTILLTVARRQLEINRWVESLVHHADGRWKLLLLGRTAAMQLSTPPPHYNPPNMLSLCRNSHSLSRTTHPKIPYHTPWTFSILHDVIHMARLHVDMLEIVLKIMFWWVSLKSALFVLTTTSALFFVASLFMEIIICPRTSIFIFTTFVIHFVSVQCT